MIEMDVGLVQMAEFKIEICKIENAFREKGLTTNNYRIVLSELLNRSLQRNYKSLKRNVRFVNNCNEPTLFKEEG
ncbi:hypothetical protein LCGC14_2552510 [marine sediment metagenome]|uniref:Uncharacterized protein n=1 Tax=marine sediment metagenome TaxID=412755 RepID=A0A0F9AME5_9ZZZZ